MPINNPLLSICIPTNGRVNVLMETLDSIYSSSADLTVFEVVIYDSSNVAILQDSLLKKYSYKNLHYYHGENMGYLNLFTVLNYGKGDFLKLHNDYSVFQEGALLKLIDDVARYRFEKPLLFFSNSKLKLPNYSSFNSYNEFIFNASYYVTWSTCFGIWKSDFALLKTTSLEPMFPHTSLLFKMQFKDNYIIINEERFYNRDIKTKGGYNLFETFAVRFIKMLNDLFTENHITEHTLQHVKSHIFWNFFVVWYLNLRILKNQYNFDSSNIKEHIQSFYPKRYFCYMVFFAYCRLIIAKLIHLFKSN